MTILPPAMTFKRTLLGAALAATLATSASAALIAYEGFDYTDIDPLPTGGTPLTGLNGGIGWNEPFPSVTSSGGTWVLADGLSFAGLPSAGKSTKRTASATLTANGRNWAASLSAGTYWYSFLMKPTVIAADPVAVPAITASVARGTFGILQNGSGSDNQNGYGIRFDKSGTTGPDATLTIQAQSPSQAGGTTLSFASGWDSTYLVVGKLVVTIATSTTVSNSIWVYKQGTAVPADEAALGTAMSNVSNSVTAAPYPALYGRAFGDSAPTFFDEVRVGTAYVDVITAVADGIAPTIIGQPNSVSFYTGQSAVMSVGVTGTPPFTYSWRKMAGAIPDVSDAVVSTASSLTFSPAATSNSGTYYVTVSNATEPAVTSTTATLTVTDSIPASITTQPVNTTVNAGVSAALTVVAAGDPVPTYQWKKITGAGVSTNVAGATTATLNVVANFVNEGSYFCEVKNAATGILTTTVNSDTVVLTALVDGSEGDIDNDGMADSLEKYLSHLGFVVGVSNTVKVQSLVNSGYAVSFTGTTPPPSEVNELALTPTTVTRNGSNVVLSFGVKEADTTSSAYTTKTLQPTDVSVDSNGKIILSLPDGFSGATDFYRLGTDTK